LKTEQNVLKEKVKKAGLEAKIYIKINKLFSENGYKIKIITDRSREYGIDQPTAWIVKRI
jgi:hypothetical protein